MHETVSKERTERSRRACAKYVSMTSCTVWHCPGLLGALRMDMKQPPLLDASTGSSDSWSLRALFVLPLGHDAHGDIAPAGGESPAYALRGWGQLRLVSH